MQVEKDIQRGVVEFYYDTLKAMDVDSDSDADYPFEFDMIRAVEIPCPTCLTWSHFTQDKLKI